MRTEPKDINFDRARKRYEELGWSLERVAHGERCSTTAIRERFIMKGVKIRSRSLCNRARMIKRIAEKIARSAAKPMRPETF